MYVGWTKKKYYFSGKPVQIFILTSGAAIKFILPVELAKKLFWGQTWPAK